MMKLIEKPLTITLALLLFFSIAGIIGNLIPWYTQENPYKVEKKTYVPGDTMQIEISRQALINLTGRVVRELVRLHDDVEEEVYKVSYDIEMDRGKKSIEVFYKIPTLKDCPQLGSNTFIWRGSIVYKPFGLPERSVHFVTEEFHIKAEKNESYAS